ncbi:MAG: ankyrin repeat domain-containing protein, partial [Myxococcota bacterium]|nr:ankyrin repeat domain-containing protein [Myxococcota bacterium]
HRRSSTVRCPYEADPPFMSRAVVPSRPTTLHRAARSGDPMRVRQAVAEGVSVDATMVTGWTPLHDAATAPDPGALEALLHRDAAVDASTKDGLTPLMVAASGGRSAGVGMLLEAGADPDALADAGRTPLESALQGGHVQVAQALCRAGASIDEGLAVLYVRALLVGRGRRVRFVRPRFPEARYTWAVDGPLPLDVHDVAPVRGFLRAPPSTGGLSFHAPVDWRAAPELFGDHEAGDGLPSERWSWRQGWSEAAQAVLHGERPPDVPDAFGNLALLDAIRAAAAPVVAALLEAGADPRVLPPKGCMRGATLLMNAAHAGHVDLVEILLGAGAKLDAHSPTGWTALMCAAGQGHREVVHTLLRAGADASLRNAQGRTAMGVAQRRGHAAVARSLLVAMNAHHLRRLTIAED